MVKALAIFIYMYFYAGQILFFLSLSGNFGAFVCLVSTLMSVPPGICSAEEVERRIQGTDDESGWRTIERNFSNWETALSEALPQFDYKI